MDLKYIAMGVWALGALNETLFGCDADEVPPWLDGKLDRFDALFKVISENVLD